MLFRSDVEKVGYLTLIINAMIAFLLNVSVVFLVSNTLGKSAVKLY